MYYDYYLVQVIYPPAYIRTNIRDFVLKHFDLMQETCDRLHFVTTNKFPTQFFSQLKNKI